MDLYNELFGDVTCDFWIKKQQSKVKYIHSIDWKNCELTMKQPPFIFATDDADPKIMDP